MSDILYYAPGSSTVIDHNFKRDQEIESLRARLAEADAKTAELREALGCEMDDTRNACGVLNAEIDRLKTRLTEAETATGTALLTMLELNDSLKQAKVLLLEWQRVHDTRSNIWHATNAFLATHQSPPRCGKNGCVKPAGHDGNHAA